MHKQRFKIGSLVTSWKARQIIFNDFNIGGHKSVNREFVNNEPNFFINSLIR